MVALAPALAATVMETDRRARSFRSRLISELTRSRRVGSPISARSLAVDAPAAHFTLGPARELNGVLATVATPGHDATLLFASFRDRDFANAIWRDFTHRQVVSEGGTGASLSSPFGQ